nr:tail fiber domain-containing protein [candidate division Zixibacteria bacterium]
MSFPMTRPRTAGFETVFENEINQIDGIADVGVTVAIDIVCFGRFGIWPAFQMGFRVVRTIVRIPPHGACDPCYKENIQTISCALAEIDKLRGVSFKWKKDKYPEHEFDDKPQLGLIAQEVKEVFPELVMQDNDGYCSVDYVKLTPVLIEAVKELKIENDALKVRLTHLRSLVESILAQQDGSNGDGATIAGEISK